MKSRHCPVRALLFTAVLLAVVSIHSYAQHREHDHDAEHLCGPAQLGPGLAPGEHGLVDRFNYPWHPGKHLERAAERRGSLSADNCGQFQIDFEDVIKGNRIGFDDRTPLTHPVLGNTTLGALRRRTVCEVFGYISGLIEIQSTPDIIIQESEIDGGGFLAAASPFFGGMGGGFTGGTLLSHIVSGTNATPLPGQYDARIIFDFGFKYHEDWTTSPGNAIDLYSVTLHEITHALGFFSLISPNGSSAISGAYSLFDRRMRDGQGNPMVDLSTAEFNGNLAAITSDALNFQGEICPSPAPIYSPVVYRPGSSLSHFDSYRSGIRYVMRPSTGGGADRVYTPDEIQVLCDLGYTLRDRSCSRCAPRGVDDYANTLQGEEVCVDVLANDISTDGGPLAIDAASVQILAGGGSFRIDGNLLCYTPDPSFTGLARISYAPRNDDAVGSAARVLVNVVPLTPGTRTRKDNLIWYFGLRAGLSFASGAPIPLTDGALESHEAAATMCDKDGNLLFYTNGATVWDATHNVMQGGELLATHPSSTQAAMIVPMPNRPSMYYIFTTSTPENRGGPLLYFGVRYSVVDMTANGGRGAVVQNDIKILETGSEKLTATPHGNGRDYWVLTRQWGTDLVHAFLVSCDGITGPVTSATGGAPYRMNADTSYSFRSTVGYLKVSPDGRKVASANTFIWVPGADFTASNIELFDFDNMTGRISNRITLDNPHGEYYGVAFSPDNSKLYAGGWKSNGYLLQYDLSAPDSASLVNSRKTIEIPGSASAGAMQLGPDGKIYVAFWGSAVLGVINKPNELAPDCDYQHEGLHLLGRRADHSLNNMMEMDPNRPIMDGMHFRVVKTVNDDTPRYGDTITYTITVCNETRCSPASVTLEDVLPQGLEYVDGMDGYPNHPMPDLLGGECRTIHLRAVVGDGTPLGVPVVNCAGLRGPVPGKDSVDLDSSCATIMISGFDLGVTKLVDKESVVNGDRVTYTISVVNYGPVDATNAVVRDRLPAGLRYAGHTVTGPGTYNPSTGDLTIPLLPVGGVTVLQIECYVEWRRGRIENCVEFVYADQSDMDPVNNRACATIWRGCTDVERTVRGGIARNHLATLEQSITIPVMLYEDLNGEEIRRIRIAMEYDSTIMVLWNGRQATDLTDGTLLDGWRIVSVSDKRGRYAVELESPGPRTYLTGAGTLLNPRFGVYLGRTIGSELPVRIEVPDNRCIAIAADTGYAKLDSICGLELRLIELIPGMFGIKPVYPNPVGSRVTFDFSIGLDAHTRLEIIDAAGAVAATPVNTYLQPGRYSVEWDASQYPAGVYYYRITSSDWNAGGKFVVVK